MWRKLTQSVVAPISVWDDPTEETCFEVDILPPYEPTWNTTSISYRFASDPSVYANLIVENSCISISSASINTLQLIPISSYDWDRWLYAALAIGFAVIFLENYFRTNDCRQWWISQTPFWARDVYDYNVDLVLKHRYLWPHLLCLSSTSRPIGLHILLFYLLHIHI